MPSRSKCSPFAYAETIAREAPQDFGLIHWNAAVFKKLQGLPTAELSSESVGKGVLMIFQQIHKNTRAPVIRTPS